MVLECEISAFGGVELVYVWGYDLVSDIPVFLDDMLVFCADLVIDNLEVDLLASQSEAVHYKVVVCNAILILLGLEGGKQNCVGAAMLGGHYALVTVTRSDGEPTSVICVKLGYWFGKNVHLIQADGWKGINREGCWSVGGIIGIGFGGSDALPSPCKMKLDGFVGGIDGNYRAITLFSPW